MAKIYRVSILLWLILLAACTNHQALPIPQNSTTAEAMAAGAAGGALIGAMSTGVGIPLTTAMGGIAGGAVGMILTEQNTLLHEMDREYIQIIRVGEEVMLVLPADKYFYKDSTHINQNFYNALDHVATYIQKFETESIKVAGYTDSTGEQIRNLALSRQQAQNIAHYLWKQGLDARMMYSIGYGCDFPIATNETEQGRSANRRVQITFRHVHEDLA